MNRQIVFALAGGVAAGFLAGYLFFGKGPQGGGPIVAAPTTPSSQVPGPVPAQTETLPSGMPLPNAEIQARIARLEALLLTDPKNREAWVALGNDYYDTHQAQKSVNAYAKALALQPGDPNVLTDQGMMYRHLNQPDKALVNFQKANKLKPDHLQSLFCMGLVYAAELQKPDEAAKAWNRIITLAPLSPQAAQARQMLGQLKK